MEKLILQLNSFGMDKFTRAEIKRFIEHKIDEHMKFRGQIGRDLRRFGEDAFTNPAAYKKLREKYKRAHANRKKLEILALEQKFYCKGESQ